MIMNDLCILSKKQMKKDDYLPRFRETPAIY
jgi:hypothetical protein